MSGEKRRDKAFLEAKQNGNLHCIVFLILSSICVCRRWNVNDKNNPFCQFVGKCS